MGEARRARPPWACRLRPAGWRGDLAGANSAGRARNGKGVVFSSGGSAGGNVYAADPIVYANDAPVGGVQQGTTFFHNFPPGKYRFTVQPFGTPTREHDTLQLAAGMQAYVQVQWEPNWEANHTGGGSSFTLLTSSPEVGQQYLPTLTNLGQR